MSNELVFNYPAGATLYVLLFDATGQIYNGSTFGAPSSASWTDYDIAMTEAATATGIYRATMPAVAAGVYGWVVRKQAGGSPVVSDVTVGAGSFAWDGTAEIVPADTAALLAAMNADPPAVDVTKWKTATAPAMTGDAYARLGAPAGASVSADIAALKAETAAILEDTGTTLPAAIALIGSVPSGSGTGTGYYSDTIDDGASPLDGVRVQLYTAQDRVGLAYEAFTDALGVFEMWPDPGTYYRWLDLAGYSFTQDVEVEVTEP